MKSPGLAANIEVILESERLVNEYENEEEDGHDDCIPHLFARRRKHASNGVESEMVCSLWLYILIASHDLY